MSHFLFWRRRDQNNPEDMGLQEWVLGQEFWIWGLVVTQSNQKVWEASMDGSPEEKVMLIDTRGRRKAMGQVRGWERQEARLRVEGKE